VALVVGLALPSFLAPAANRSVNSLPVFGGVVGALSGSVPGVAAGELDAGVGDGDGDGDGGSAVGTAGGTGTGTGAGVPPPLAATSPIPITAIPTKTATTITRLRFGRKSRLSIDAVAGNDAGKGGTDDGSEGTKFGGNGASDCCGMRPGGAGAVGADDEVKGTP
jgi:hypothetical protein